MRTMKMLCAYCYKITDHRPTGKWWYEGNCRDKVFEMACEECGTTKHALKPIVPPDWRNALTRKMTFGDGI